MRIKMKSNLYATSGFRISALGENIVWGVTKSLSKLIQRSYRVIVGSVGPLTI